MRHTLSARPGLSTNDVELCGDTWLGVGLSVVWRADKRGDGRSGVILRLQACLVKGWFRIGAFLCLGNEKMRSIDRRKTNVEFSIDRIYRVVCRRHFFRPVVEMARDVEGQGQGVR